MLLFSYHPIGQLCLGGPGSGSRTVSEHRVYSRFFLLVRCLVAHCYSLWFIHLPAYVKVHHNKAKVLHVAFEVSRNMIIRG